MIKSVKVLDWCISCRNCENVCPKIFKVNPTSKVISTEFAGNETEILMAEAMCPVQVIKVEKKEWLTLSFKKSNLLSKKYLTSDIIELILEKPKNFSYKPWQYISIMFEDWKGKFSRQYSIAEVTDKAFSLTIRLWYKWRWATQIKKMKVWKKINFLWPLWAFYLQDNKKEKYFISTGTWLAPFIAMWENCDKNVKKHFIVWARKKEDLYYQEKIENYPNSTTHYFLSQEEAEWCEKWRVTDYLKNIPKEISEIYICGNPEMVKSVLDYTKANWYDEKAVFSEDFTVSGKYEPLWKEIFINWNIPFVKEISWWIIIFSFLFSAYFLYMNFAGSIFENFLFFWTLAWFLLNLSWFCAAFVMLIRPISDIFPKNNFLRKLKNFRKPFWILSSMLILVYFTRDWFIDPEQMISYFTTPWRWNNLTALIARTSELTAVVLLLTSNVFSQKTLGKNWKRIQYLSYAYFISWWLNAILNMWEATIWWYLQYHFILTLWIILLILAFIQNRKNKN